MPLQQLANAVELAEEHELSDPEQQGIIQEFEFTHELSWKVLKNFLEYQGISNILRDPPALQPRGHLGIEHRDKVALGESAPA